MALAPVDTTVGEALADIREEIAETETELGDTDPDAAAHDSLQSLRARLIDQRAGFEHHREHDGWAEDASIQIGAPTAGERALADREAPDDAGAQERTLWVLAAATEEAPWAAGDLSATFREVSQLHPGVTDWCDLVVSDVRGGGTGNPIERLLETATSET